MEQEQLKSLIEEIFGKTKVITVKSVSPSIELPNVAAALRFNIKEDRDYSVALNCHWNCSTQSNSLKQYLISGLNVIGNCRPPFTAFIELEGDLTIEEIYIHDTGHCFTINDISYFTNDSFFDLAPNFSMYPSFLRN